ncbi:hypothetical protein BWZ22_10085 [Seonamhaeicola sp. S2-3]|uniref:LacI family DNA-binding transcriptional regulator n=1 Tax=Seonamhaeicola sp. S2-3 TaxID=1936081 RepID=UPI000972C542|nr:LacI family DNA-binding transcriptional regulator [Seonamhaeicola sp. S2-3]APY11567.1 hypothetical protein BWZ22_10085 [Seonamhaeicola sp. S2-3]
MGKTKKYSLKDIAEDLNVSKTTVSLVLNDKGNENKISQETQKRIKAYAKKNGYAPNQLARGLSRGKSEAIGLIVPDISDQFYAKIAGIIEKKAKKLGYNVVYSSTYEDSVEENKLIRSMLNRQIDGLIIASTQNNADDIQMLKHERVPFVLIDRHYPDKETDYVVVNNFKGMKIATEHILNLGRRKLGFISLNTPLDALNQRYNGFKAALNDCGIELDEKRVKTLNQGYFADEMPNAIKQLVENENVDSLVFGTHYLTMEGLRILKSINVKVPEEVAIVSFDETQAFDLISPPITAVIQPINDIGSLALEILLKKIENRKTTNKLNYENIILDLKLEVRKSCGIKD